MLHKHCIPRHTHTHTNSFSSSFLLVLNQLNVIKSCNLGIQQNASDITQFFGWLLYLQFKTAGKAVKPSWKDFNDEIILETSWSYFYRVHVTSWLTPDLGGKTKLAEDVAVSQSTTMQMGFLGAICLTIKCCFSDREPRMLTPTSSLEDAEK